MKAETIQGMNPQVGDLIEMVLSTPVPETLHNDAQFKIAGYFLRLFKCEDMWAIEYLHGKRHGSYEDIENIKELIIHKSL